MCTKTGATMMSTRIKNKYREKFRKEQTFVHILSINLNIVNEGRRKPVIENIYSVWKQYY